MTALALVTLAHWPFIAAALWGIAALMVGLAIISADESE